MIINIIIGRRTLERRVRDRIQIYSSLDRLNLSKINRRDSNSTRQKEEKKFAWNNVRYQSSNISNGMQRRWTGIASGAYEANTGMTAEMAGDGTQK